MPGLKVYGNRFGFLGKGTQDCAGLLWGIINRQREQACLIFRVESKRCSGDNKPCWTFALNQFCAETFSRLLHSLVADTTFTQQGADQVASELPQPDIFIEHQKAVLKWFFAVSQRSLGHRGESIISATGKEAENVLHKKRLAAGRRSFDGDRNRALKQSANERQEEELGVSVFSLDSNSDGGPGESGSGYWARRSIPAMPALRAPMWAPGIAREDALVGKRLGDSVPLAAEVLCSCRSCTGISLSLQNPWGFSLG
jgi:hypothetical protein